MKSHILLLTILVGAACHKSHSSTPGAGPQPAALQLGDPLPGLTADELAAFERGKVLFGKRFGPSDGLGPLYNATSCASCHSKPVMGGSAELYRNFYVATLGGPGASTTIPPLPSPVVPAFGGDTLDLPWSSERGRWPIPQAFVQVAQRNSIPTFGTGLFEFISNDTITSNADPDDLDGDGISGRTNRDGAGHGRFGVKAQSNNIEFFTRAPLMNQMGITTQPFNGSAGTVSLEHGMMVQASSNPNAATTDDDGVTDPELKPHELGDLIAFTRFLAPPQPKAFDAAATRGEQLFSDIGCAKCHIPELPSSRGPVRAYTDLLIHDMGPDLADNVGFGTPQTSLAGPDHTGSEFRSAPLWGVSHFGPYMHDGRAATLDEAIRLHGGEAAAIRDLYEALSVSERADIISFLEHL
ncbi:MAG: di-heme oxidoredictase family protein [Planctomycetota bacterium]